MPPGNVNPSDQLPPSTIKTGLLGIGSTLRSWFKGGSSNDSTSQPSAKSTPEISISPQLPPKTVSPKGPPQTSPSESRRPSSLSQKGITTRDVGDAPRDARTLKQSLISFGSMDDDLKSAPSPVDVAPVEIPCIKLPRSLSAGNGYNKPLPPPGGRGASSSTFGQLHLSPKPSVLTPNPLATMNLIPPSPIPTVHTRNLSKDIPPSPPSMTPQTIPGYPSPTISTLPTTLLPVPPASNSSTQSGFLPSPKVSHKRKSAVSTGPSLVTARMIKDLRSISYPEGIARPNPELNVNTKPGKFIYDRPFLLQFMVVCTENPGILFDMVVLDAVDNHSAPHLLMTHAKPATPGGVTTVSSTPPGEMEKITPSDAPTPNTVHDPAMPSGQQGPTTQISGQDDPRKKRTRTKRGGKRNANNDQPVDVPTEQVVAKGQVVAEGQVVKLGIDEGIARDIEELFSVRDINWSEAYFIKLPIDHHHQLVYEMVLKAVDSTEEDGRLVADVLERAARKRLCSASAFEKGFLPVAEILDNIVNHYPEALWIMTMMMKGAGLDKDEGRRTRIVQKSTNRDNLLELLEWNPLYD